MGIVTPASRGYWEHSVKVHECVKSQHRAWHAAVLAKAERTSLVLLPLPAPQIVTYMGIFLLPCQWPRLRWVKGNSAKPQSENAKLPQGPRFHSAATEQGWPAGPITRLWNREGPNNWNSEGQGAYVLSSPLGRKLLLYWSQMACIPTLANCFPRRKSFQFQIYSLFPIKVIKVALNGGCSLEGEVTWTRFPVHFPRRINWENFKGVVVEIIS